MIYIRSIWRHTCTHPCSGVTLSPEISVLTRLSHKQDQDEHRATCSHQKEEEHKVHGRPWSLPIPRSRSKDQDVRAPYCRGRSYSLIKAHFCSQEGYPSPLSVHCSLVLLPGGPFFSIRKDPCLKISSFLHLIVAHRKLEAPKHLIFERY